MPETQLTRVGRGCVSGAQIENFREIIKTSEGKYDFDMIDGFDEMRCVLLPRISIEDLQEADCMNIVVTLRSKRRSAPL